MKQLFAFLLPLIFACNMNPNSEIDAIKSVLSKQLICWNKGDIEGFMLGYWQSDSLEFTSGSEMTKGWEKTLERYKKAYPNQESMGTLQFEIGEVTFITITSATLSGKWELIRKSDNPKGSFLLTFNKIEGQWFIIKDYTTSE